MKSDADKSISIDPAKHAASAHGILGCRDCHISIKDFPHPAKISEVKCSTCHAAESSSVPNSAHGVLGEEACSSCHGNVHELTSAARLAPAKCEECHGAEVKEFHESIHGQAEQAGDPDAPKCASCHGPVHNIRTADDPSSTVGKKNLPDTCAACHSSNEFLSRHKIPIAHPVEKYRQSVHGRAVMAEKNAASCSDCHGSHGILPARDPHSSVSHWNVADTCGACHKEIAETFKESVHGQAIAAGVQDAPDCTACHGEHLILAPTNPASPVFAANVSAETCGRCHSDTRLARLYDLPADRVPSYADSYHGLALREGSLTAANCASCHGVHNIFPSSDPRSTVNQANLSKTCGNCHQGIGTSASIGRVHVQISSGPAHPVVRWIRWTYLILIPLTLAFMLLHNLIDFISKMIHPPLRVPGGERVVRMNLRFRIAHWGVMLSFPVLVYTGFALKYPEAWWAKPLLVWEEGAAFRGGVHRAAAILLIAATLYHCVHLALNRRDRAFLKSMLPQMRDVADLAAVLRFNLRLSQTPPQFGKFNYAEKLEYWAFLWGTSVMALSGFLLWFNNFALRHFPKWVTDAATAVHWYEALLATLSILLWHFYLVIFDPLVYPMDLAWLNGKIPAEHYEHTRPAYLAALRRPDGRAKGQPSQEGSEPGTGKPERRPESDHK
jgi:formate dehydrogenase gamma subunit